MLNGNRPRYMEGRELPDTYYDMPDPYREPPKGVVNLLALSKYLAVNGKKVAELSAEEMTQFFV